MFMLWKHKIQEQVKCHNGQNILFQWLIAIWILLQYSTVNGNTTFNYQDNTHLQASKNPSQTISTTKLQQSAK